MNQSEADNVVRYLMRSWPQAANWDDQQIGLWIDDLIELPADRSMRAMKACREEHHFPPSWAQFKEAYRTVTFAEIAPERQPLERALPAGYVDKASGLEHVQRLRRMLKAIPAREHNHHPKTIDGVRVSGPASCPVCRDHDWVDGVHTDKCRRCRALGEQAYNASKEHA